MRSFSLDDLRAVLRRAAGEDEDVDLDGAIADRRYADLGYDSLALLEVSAQIQQTYQVAIADGDLHGAATPADTVRLVNRLLEVVAVA